MSQFGNLSSAQQTTFLANQAARVREPSTVIWIEGIGDPTNYILSIDTEVGLESPRGRGYLNIGSGVITASNEDDTFYTAGASQIEKNARIKVWAGFDGLNIPIFSGVVDSVHPVPQSDTVELSCIDLMGLFKEPRVDGSQGTNNTIKLIIEDFCSSILATESIPSTDETTETLDAPTFEPQPMLSALEECCDCLFSVLYFDEDGTGQLHEREYRNYLDWTFDEDNILEDGVKLLVPTEIINSVEVEYRENYLARYEDQMSIGSYRERARRLRLLLLNSIEIASKTTGSTTETVDYDLEGFKFTSASAGGEANIDCVAVWMMKDGAAGPMTLKIYSDSAGSPDTLLGTSEIRQADDVPAFGFAKIFFYFTTPVTISQSTDYWGILDSSSTTGTLYFRISAATATAKHVYDDSGWTTENDKQVMFIVRQSRKAQRVAEDLVRFHKDPHDRLRIIAPAVPQLQLFDEVLVDISTPFIIGGRWLIESRRHRIGPDAAGDLVYTTTDVLRKTG